MYLMYTKYVLITAYFVFLFGAGITMKELLQFLVQEETNATIGAVIIMTILALISCIGLYGALREDSCILMTYGSIILLVFVFHVILLFVLKNLCTNTQRKCYRNMATPPGLAPILVAISELAIGVCAFFMALVIESEKGTSERRRVARSKTQRRKVSVMHVTQQQQQQLLMAQRRSSHAVSPPVLPLGQHPC